MSFHTVIGQKLEIAIQQELIRMDNGWFFRWHFIGRDGPVEIESFRGRPIIYGGITYSGTAVDVYWETISHYAKIKVSEFFDLVESELTRHPRHVRGRAINEAKGLINMFVSSIRRRAIDKDRILRGDGVNFPDSNDKGRWEGSSCAVIDARVKGLLESYCDLSVEHGGIYVVEHMMNEMLSFVKADGTEHKKGIKGLVAGGKIITFDSSLPVQPNDRFLRELPSGLVEEYIVEAPGYQGGIPGSIKPHFQAKVRRSDAPAVPMRTIINNIHGENARVNIDSVDNSQNLVTSAPGEQVFQDMRERLVSAGIDAVVKERIMVAIDEMEMAKGTPTFKEKYQSFMAVASDHAGVFGALLAALAMLV